MTAVSIGVLSHEFQTCCERKDLIPLREGEQQGLFLIQKGVEVERTFQIRCQARSEGELPFISKERFEAWQHGLPICYRSMNKRFQRSPEMSIS